MKVVIAGSRTLLTFKPIVDAILFSGYNITEVVSGGAAGADKYGEKWANENGLPIKQFIANWSMYGPSAGPRRNKLMGEYGDAAIIIWDGESRGSKNMISVMVAQRKPHTIAIYKDPLWINPTYTKVEY